MTKAFGYKFINCFGEKDNGIWFDALKDLTQEDLAHGFRKMIKSTSEHEREKGEAWPPNLKEFRMYCERQLSDYGLPHVNRAFDEIERNQWRDDPVWSHPLVFLAGKIFDEGMEFQSNALFQNFREIYNELTERYIRGEIKSLPVCRTCFQSAQGGETEIVKLHCINKIDQYFKTQGGVGC